MKKMLLALALVANVAGVAHANDDAATWDLHVEIEGQDYVADYRLTKDDCIFNLEHISEFEIAANVWIDVPADADVYCLNNERG